MLRTCRHIVGGCNGTGSAIVNVRLVVCKRHQCGTRLVPNLASVSVDRDVDAFTGLFGDQIVHNQAMGRCGGLWSVYLGLCVRHK
ncbi:hypothetical protein CGCTS75_v003277 [Colletotrichum tropicale]|nr:hypothetical protein CGCTS75_v003277 [Colletotrichum tropicale]